MDGLRLESKVPDAEGEYRLIPAEGKRLPQRQSCIVLEKELEQRWLLLVNEILSGFHLCFPLC